jgi:hypothetical protein
MQYDEFLAQGLITEPNLDRFDTTCLTWRHPCFSRERVGLRLPGTTEPSPRSDPILIREAHTVRLWRNPRFENPLL